MTNICFIICFRDKLTRSTVGLVNQGHITVTSCNPGDKVLVFWDTEHKNYTIYLESSTFYFINSDCLGTLELGFNPDGSPQRQNIVAQVVDKEFCHAKKVVNWITGKLVNNSLINVSKVFLIIFNWWFIFFSLEIVFAYHWAPNSTEYGWSQFHQPNWRAEARRICSEGIEKQHCTLVWGWRNRRQHFYVINKFNYYYYREEKFNTFVIIQLLYFARANDEKKNKQTK